MGGVDIFVAVEETNIRVSCFRLWSEIVKKFESKRVRSLAYHKVKRNWEKRTEFWEYS